MGRHRAGSYDLSLTGCTFADGKVPCISGYFEDLVVDGCTGNGGLNGFVYSALAANAIRFIAVIIWGFLSIRKPASNVPTSN
jgi:hypothetical protein